MTDVLIGQQLSNYRIERIIGQGGMATVYYGWDVSLERPVAIKVVDARFRQNPAYAQRFVQEARSVAKWRHDNIVQVFFAGQENDISFFAMEYIDGPDLGQVMRQYVDDGELMPYEDVVRLGRAIASALDYAHERQVIHRDVKPSNVMIAKNGRIVLTDFGLALNTQQGSIGEIFGTPHYIAPEQARNSAMAVAQSDLYALGVILFEMLTGAVPFDDPSPTSLALQHLTQAPPKPRDINARLNEATEHVLLKALSKAPNERYQTGAELMGALADALDQPETAVAEEESDLPPLPGGIAPPVLSQTSVAERVSFFLPPPPTAGGAEPPATFTPTTTNPAPQIAPAPSPAAPPVRTAPTAAKKQPWGLIAVGAIILLLLLFFGGRALMGGDDEDGETTTASITDEPVLEVDVAETPDVEPSATAAATESEAETAVATDEPEPESVVTEPESTATTESVVADTPTAEPAPTETAVIEPEPTQAPQVEVAPTVLYPNGHRLELIYNPSSFYIFNASPDRVRVSSLKFEALNDAGQPVGYNFDGYRWSQFYSFVDSNSCVRLEILKRSNYLRPGKCRNYNSTITPPEGDPEVFWLNEAGATQFRILWEDQEVARCSITADLCEVFVP